ncbi:DUF4956 domain-containing protein [Planctomycetota bacterium]
MDSAQQLQESIGMDKLQTFEQFLTTQSVHVPLVGFVINLLLGAVLSWVLGRIYVKHANTLSNRTLFAKNFVLLTMTTLLIITVVKSSLALSLGLVGALSIVRFRSAIKEPEELAYLFLNIAIGLGLGADQRLITVVAFIVIVLILVLGGHRSRKDENKNLHLTISSQHPEEIPLAVLVGTIKQHCAVADLKRFDETGQVIEAVFALEIDDFEALNHMKLALQELSQEMRITFLDSKGIC